MFVSGVTCRQAFERSQEIERETLFVAGSTEKRRGDATCIHVYTHTRSFINNTSVMDGQVALVAYTIFIVMKF